MKMIFTGLTPNPNGALGIIQPHGKPTDGTSKELKRVQHMLI